MKSTTKTLITFSPFVLNYNPNEARTASNGERNWSVIKCTPPHYRPHYTTNYSVIPDKSDRWLLALRCVVERAISHTWIAPNHRLHKLTVHAVPICQRQKADRELIVSSSRESAATHVHPRLLAWRLEFIRRVYTISPIEKFMVMPRKVSWLNSGWLSSTKLWCDHFQPELSSVDNIFWIGSFASALSRFFYS